MGPRVLINGIWYNIPEVMARVGVGRDKLYRLIREGKLPARKLGRKTLILRSDLEAFLESLPKMGRGHDRA